MAQKQKNLYIRETDHIADIFNLQLFVYIT